jgi:hypothetical protein
VHLKKGGDYQNEYQTVPDRPSVLNFSLRCDAERFAQGFGGSALDFVKARSSIGEMMAIWVTGKAEFEAFPHER